MPEPEPATDTYEWLIALLNSRDASYELIDHPPEGRTELVSGLRGHPAAQAAKCVLVMVKVDRKTRRYVLAVVPGDTRVDLGAIKRLYDGRYAGFADNATAERLAGSISGTILPFVLDDAVELVVDPAMLDSPVMYFNAARLDRSLRLSTNDYSRIAEPRVESIAEPTFEEEASHA